MTTKSLGLILIKFGHTTSSKHLVTIQNLQRWEFQKYPTAQLLSHNYCNIRTPFSFNRAWIPALREPVLLSQLPFHSTCLVTWHQLDWMGDINELGSVHTGSCYLSCPVSSHEGFGGEIKTEHSSLEIYQHYTRFHLDKRMCRLARAGLKENQFGCLETFHMYGNDSDICVCQNGHGASI